MEMNTQLVFPGNCEAAFKVYEQCLGAQITFLLTYGDSPLASTYPDLQDKILRATLRLANTTLSGTDASPVSYTPPHGFNLQLNLHRDEDVQRIFNTLSDGGTVHVPLQKTFWAERYAVLTDRFGIPWKINGA